MDESLAEALEREHREIDAGVEAFQAGVAVGENRTEQLLAAIGALRRHIYLEEEFLFPPMRSTGLMAPVFVMVREHGEMWRTLDALVPLLAADASSPEVLSALSDLVSQLQSHNPKEEQILYPQADAVLDADAGERLAALIATGTLPDGWECEGVRAGAKATPFG